MDRERRPRFRDDSVRGMHAYDPQASPTEMRRLSGGLAGLYTEPALALDFQAYRPRDVLAFPADKDRTWRLPTELDPVRLMHNAIRAEVTKFEALLFKLGDDKLSRWQIQCIKDWWVGHRDHVVYHHAMEDAVLHPFVLSRVNVPADFRASHDQLNFLLRAVDRAICNRTFNRASELAPVWHGYRTSLYPLLAEEEAILIPLTRAYFTPEEYGAKIGEILRSAPKLALGSLLHHLQGGKEGAMSFLVRYGYEWMAWYRSVHATRTHYREHAESKLASLLVGAPVVCRHKDDLRIMKTLRPLELNRRLMLAPVASSEVSAMIFSQMATGRWLLDVGWGGRDPAGEGAETDGERERGDASLHLHSHPRARQRRDVVS